jgi:hypothetical protein
MSAKLLFKSVFVMLMLLLLVLMGLNNRGTVSFTLPPLIAREIKTQAAIMYITIFACGFLTGTIVTATGGGGKKGGSSSKPAKSDK